MDGSFAGAHRSALSHCLSISTCVYESAQQGFAGSLDKPAHSADAATVSWQIALANVAERQVQAVVEVLYSASRDTALRLATLAEDPCTLSALCRDIKHLYHYYLHGPSGRRPGQSGPATVNDGILPNIVIQCTHNSHLKWRHSLVDVCDDMESKYLEVSTTHPRNISKPHAR